MKIDNVSTLFLRSDNPKSIETEPAQANFASWLSEKISDTNDQLNEADTALNQLAAGHAQNLHQTMITLEQAKLSFNYLEQIRNRLMSAYQEILREQI